MPDRSTRYAGLWSASLCILFSLTYVVAQLAEWMGLLGSAGGPHSRSTPLGMVLLLTPSLLLSLAFVVLVVSIHHIARPAARIWSHIAIGFAAMYATMVSIVYYVQLSFVMPRIATGKTEDIRLLIFEPFDSFLYAIDVFGYSLMCLSLLFIARVFVGNGLEKWIRRLAIANGCLIPFLSLQMFYPMLIWGGSLWAITFPAVTLLLAVYFRSAPDARF